MTELSLVFLSSSRHMSGYNINYATPATFKVIRSSQFSDLFHVMANPHFVLNTNDYGNEYLFLNTILWHNINF